MAYSFPISIQFPECVYIQANIIYFVSFVNLLDYFHVILDIRNII